LRIYRRSAADRILDVHINDPSWTYDRMKFGADTADWFTEFCGGWRTERRGFCVAHCARAVRQFKEL